MVNAQANGAMNLYTALAFVIADIIALALRIISKRKTKNGLRADDWWICVGLAFYFVWCGLIIYEVAASGGSLELTSMRHPKCLWVSTFFFPLSFTATKISILYFYRSIFTIRPFRLATHVVMILCLMWCVFVLFFMAFKCPIKATWDSRMALTAQCFPYGSFALGAELSNLILDVAILAIPVFVVSSLHLETQRKVLVASIFLLGGFVIITSICHAIYSYDPRGTKFVDNFPKAILWTTIETGTAIICACLPMYRPLVPQHRALFTKIKSWYSSIRGTFNSEGSEVNLFSRSPPNSNGHNQSDGSAKGSIEIPMASKERHESRLASNNDELFYSKNAITVETRIDIV